MPRIIPKEQRDYITQERNGETTIYRNPRTNQQVELNRHASSHEKRMAIKSLQQVIDDPFEGVKANEGLDRMAGAKPAERSDDVEPYVPLSPGRLRDKALKAHAEWTAKRDAAAQRQRELRDRRELIEGIAEAVKAELPEAQAPAPPDLTSEYQRRLEATLNLSRINRDPNATAEQRQEAEQESREAWGLGAVDAST